MGRYYSLSLYNKPDALGAKQTPYRQWTSQPNGVFDPGALEIQFDITLASAATSQGASTITLAGVALDDLLQGQSFAGSYLSLEGGMTGGLPLENPYQKGLLCEGFIIQSFGNWSGVDQNLTFVVWPGMYTYDLNPGNFSFLWKANTPLSELIKSTLTSAYPVIHPVVDIGNYVRDHDVAGSYKTLSEFGIWLVKATRTKANPSGVQIFGPTNNILTVVDAPLVSGKTKQIAFNDLIGQPTWLENPKMQFATVLRGDIVPATSVLMPEGLANNAGATLTTVGANQYNLKYKTTFQGKFGVQSVRHIGNSRDPAGTSWITLFECFPGPGNTTAVNQ